MLVMFWLVVFLCLSCFGWLFVCLFVIFWLVVCTFLLCLIVFFCLLSFLFGVAACVVCAFVV